jgi:hypothetical protein
VAKIEIPAELRGTPEQKLNQLHSYLFRLSEGLNVMLDLLENESGMQGEKGEKGDRGLQGEPGADGKSAYDSAKAGGYTGTEAEFYTALAQIDNVAADLQTLSNDFNAHKTGPIYPMSV